MTSIQSGIVRRYADVAGELRQRVMALSRDVDAMIGIYPRIASDMLPIQVLLREAEGRLCDAGDQLHAVARTMNSLREEAQ